MSKTLESMMLLFILELWLQLLWILESVSMSCVWYI